MGGARRSEAIGAPRGAERREPHGDAGEGGEREDLYQRIAKPVVTETPEVIQKDAVETELRLSRESYELLTTATTAREFYTDGGSVSLR